MLELVHSNGYLTVFVTVILSGEVGLIAGSALAHAGSVSLAGVIAVGTVASFLGTTFYYVAGKFLWQSWPYLRKRFGRRMESSSAMVNRFGPLLILVSRFFYGVRNVFPIAMGVYGVNPVLFSICNLVGGFLWAWVFTHAGALVLRMVH